LLFRRLWLSFYPLGIMNAFMNNISNRQLVLVFVIEAIAVWLFIDAGLWVSGHQRYMILFERVFDTPVSAASQMRWIQGITACVVGCVCIAWLLRRAARHKKGDSKHDA
jgi:hypothetical protein